jgi:isochorismate synthase
VSSEGTASLLGRLEPLGDAFDLLAGYGDGGSLFDRGGLGVATSGAVVATASPVAAARMLADVDRSIRGGGRVVAVGALPFGGWDRAAPSVSIAARTVRRSAMGETVRIVIGDTERSTPLERTLGMPVPNEPFAAAQLRPEPSEDEYAAAVARIVERIGAGELRKVVLARTIEVDAGRSLDPRRLVQRLRAVDPDAYSFAAPTTTGVVVGASPELLVSRFGREVRSNPLAGSAARSGDPVEDRQNAARLLGSTKDHDEHSIVVDAIAGTLGPFCRELSWDPEPVLLETPNVWHLSTRFRGLLREPSPGALELVEALHPTPAIAGEPRDAALQTISDLEPFDRGSYAGPVGWVDANGDGEWAIALRCAELRGQHATLYAGAGIVAGSQPAAEVDETERKFRAFLDALRWG